MSRLLTLPRASSLGVIWDSLPTTTIASLEVSMYLLATRETSAEVDFFDSGLVLFEGVGGVAVEGQGDLLAESLVG